MVVRRLVRRDFLARRTPGVNIFKFDFVAVKDDEFTNVDFGDDYESLQLLIPHESHLHRRLEGVERSSSVSRETGALRRRPPVGRPTQSIGIWTGGCDLDGIEEDGFSGLDPRAKGDRSQAACLRRPVPHGVRTTAAWSSPCPCARVDS